MALSEESSSSVPGLGLLATPETLNNLRARSRSELMYELRRISHKSKPVSRHGQREFLEALLRRRCGPAHDAAMASGVKSTAETSDQSCCTASKKDADEDEEETSYRPDSIVLEVRGLFEQRPVSSLLQSTFRPSLERALRQSERQRRRRLRPAPTPRRRAGQQQPRLPRARSRSPRNNRSGDVQVLVEHAQRQEILLELSDLVQQQVVSQMLASEFHGVLELHLQDHLRRSGTNGQRIQQFVQQLRGRRLARGTLAAGHTGDTSYIELVRKVDAMHNEMEELRRLVQLSFDLQLDVQRSLRQQLAAVVGAVVKPCTVIPQVPSPLDAPATFAETPRAVSRGTCVVCSAEQCDTMLYGCGHLCVCSRCALDLHNGPSPICPICRAPIKDVVRIYEV